MSKPRGMILPMTRTEAVARARSQAGKRIKYSLSRGGKYPDEPIGDRCDCSGFTAWCLGFDRLQPNGFESRGGYASTDAMLHDAAHAQQYFEEVVEPLPGDLVVYGSKYTNGKRVAVGHCGVVVSVAQDGRNAWERAKVIDCASRHYKRLGFAVAEAPDGRLWGNKGGKFLRYVRFTG